MLQPNRPGQDLSPTQLEVIRGLSFGLSQKQVAAGMGISCRTVEIHCTALRIRLDAKTSTHAVAIALRMGLIE